MTPKIIGVRDSEDLYNDILWTVIYSEDDKRYYTDKEMQEYIIANAGRKWGEGGKEAKEFEIEVERVRNEVMDDDDPEPTDETIGPFSPTGVFNTTDAAHFEDDDHKIQPLEVAAFIAEHLHILTMDDTEDIMMYQDGYYHIGAKGSVKRAIQMLLKSKTSLYLVNEILGHITRSTRITRDKLEDEGDWVCLQNGLLNVKTLDFAEHSYLRLFSTCMPVDYDPAAECLLFDTFLKQVAAPEDVPLIYEWIGYCLYPGYDFHRAVILVGKGSNGKGVLSNVVKAFLGRKNVSSVALQQLDDDKFAAANLYCKRANICADISARQIRDTGSFKGLSGGDEITAQFKHVNQFSFVNRAKLWFSCNALPMSDDLSDGFVRRVILVKFLRQFIGKDADPKLLDKLTTPQELSGLLNRSLAAIRAVYGRGDFSNSASIEATREKWVQLSDSVYMFVTTMCVMDTGEILTEAGITTSRDSAKIRKDDLWKAYLDYCMRLDILPVDNRKWKRELLRNAPNVGETRWSKTDKSRCWGGIRLAGADEGQKDARCDSVLNATKGNPTGILERKWDKLPPVKEPWSKDEPAYDEGDMSFNGQAGEGDGQ